MARRFSEILSPPPNDAIHSQWEGDRQSISALVLDDRASHAILQIDGGGRRGGRRGRTGVRGLDHRDDRPRSRVDGPPLAIGLRIRASVLGER
jgi:hypothetical protein